MLNMGDIMGNINIKLAAKSIDEPRLSEDARKVVDMLFNAFEEHVKFFAANHPNGYDYAKREWTKTFMERGVTMARVQRGIKMLRKSEKIYSSITPAEFLALCNASPLELGAPDLSAAYMEACRLSHPCETNKNWSHEAVRHAAHKTGSFFLRTESRNKTFEVFKKNYMEAIKDCFENKNLNQIEDKNGDTPENRRTYQEEFGPRCNNPTYSEWLRTGRKKWHEYK